MTFRLRRQHDHDAREKTYAVTRLADALDLQHAALREIALALAALQQHHLSLGAAVGRIERTTGDTMALIDDLATKVATLDTVKDAVHAITGTVQASFTTLRQDIVDLRTALANAPSADPTIDAKLADMGTKLDTDIASIQADTQALADAAVANTAASGETPQP